MLAVILVPAKGGLPRMLKQHVQLLHSLHGAVQGSKHLLQGLLQRLAVLQGVAQTTLGRLDDARDTLLLEAVKGAINQLVVPVAVVRPATNLQVAVVVAVAHDKLPRLLAISESIANVCTPDCWFARKLTGRGRLLQAEPAVRAQPIVSLFLLLLEAWERQHLHVVATAVAVILARGVLRAAKVRESAPGTDKTGWHVAGEAQRRSGCELQSHGRLHRERKNVG